MTLSHTDIMHGLSDEMPERSITPDEIAELARLYRENERERTKFHVPTSAVGAGLVGSGLGALLGGKGHRGVGALAGAGIGGGLGALSGHRHRKYKMKVQENLGRELGLAAMGKQSPLVMGKEGAMHKTASQIADEVLAKLR